MTALGAVLSLAALGISGALGVYVLAVNPRRPANRAFFVLMLAFVWWDACEAVLRLAPAGTPDAALLPWVDGVWLGISAVPAALLNVAFTYPEPRPWLRLPWARVLLYAPVLGWALVLFLSNGLVQGVAENPFGPSARVGTAYAPLALVYALWLAIGVGVFVATYLRLRRSEWRVMQGVVAAGLIIGTVPAAVTEIFWPLLTASETRLGLASLYTLVWSAFIAVAVVRFHYLLIPPVTETRTAPVPRHPLATGVNYLVVEPGRSAGLGAFREIVSTTPGLVITALPPSRIASRFGLERTPIVWVTMSAAGERTVRPQGLEFELVHTAVKFLKENPGTAVLLDDLDYLASVNGFEAVARFLKRVANQASASNGTVIASVGRGTFSAEQLTVLGGSVDHVLELENGGNGDAAILPSLLVAASAEVPAALARRGVSGGLLVTTQHPAKAQKRFGPGFTLLWVADRAEGDTPSLRPEDLDTQGKRALAAFLDEHPGSDVVLEGLDQLALYLYFASLLAFVMYRVDAATARGSRVLASVGPGGLAADQVARLARRFDVPAAELLRSFPPAARATAAPGSRTPTRGPAS